ncbi:hypothetical protein [Sphingomonas beigongshangi]|uniref:hypothetical protein n=1 Tax=Sphingomonas beigongshangi TaxID=2782540 RepID=UPI00193AEE87|nr:hypothetical protein [Sphingomonas beigongshangi]
MKLGALLDSDPFDFHGRQPLAVSQFREEAVTPIFRLIPQVLSTFQDCALQGALLLRLTVFAVRQAAVKHRAIVQQSGHLVVSVKLRLNGSKPWKCPAFESRSAAGAKLIGDDAKVRCDESGHAHVEGHRSSPACAGDAAGRRMFDGFAKVYGW